MGTEPLSSGNIPISVNFDGCWTKRSYNHSCNSFSGVGTVIGTLSNKILGHSTRNKQCKTCQTASNNKYHTYTSCMQ